MHSTLDVWVFRTGIDAELSTRDIVGYAVEAIDGSIGKVDDATVDVSASYIVVDTGPWILGKKVMIPAGVIRNVDHDDEKIFVHRTKDEIKDAPDLEGPLDRDSPDEYRRRLGSYYGPGGPGYRDW